MNKYYDKFIEYLYNEDKENSVNYVLSLLQNDEIDIINLYEKVLAPSLNNMVCNIEEKNVCIWKEHVRSSIVRTIIECCYPFVINTKKKSIGKKVLVFCPPEEYHDIGARISVDFFTLYGYNAIFVGSNTPKEDIINSIEYTKPSYVVISVTNYYNLFAAKKVIEDIRKLNYKDFKILVGGNAFKINSDTYKKVGADLFIDTVEQIENLERLLG